MDAVFTALLPSIILLVLMIAPMGLVLGAVLLSRWNEKREARRSPLRDKLQHQAGAQARNRADALGEGILDRLMLVALIGPLTMLVILLPRVNWTQMRFNGINWLVVAIAVAWVGWLAYRITVIRTERRKWLEGMRAEIATAQQLDRLQSQGCLVLHDIPADDFNLDHVVIGQSAVFMVETKSRRKQGEGKASANVAYDGKTLQFPTWPETKPLEQARAQARWLADYLRGETGESTPVIPVVCFPGWFVQPGKDAHRSDVRVINPKMTSLFVDAGSRPRLDTAHRNRIVHALYKRYPES